jgi:nucleoside-diphosphate-sugar epimerase
VWLTPAVGFDLAAGKVRIYGDGTARGSYATVDGVARALVACVGNPRASRQAIPVGGARPYSQLEQATFLGLFEGLAQGDVIPPEWSRTLDVQPVSLEDWVRQAFGARG